MQDEWSEPQEQTSSMTFEEMDNLVQQYHQARLKVEAASAAKKELDQAKQDLEDKVIQALKSSGKTSYTLEGVGSVGVSYRDSFVTPKTNEDKRKLFDYIKSKYGDDYLTKLLGINSNTLNGWAKSEIEADPGLTIPGLEAPTSNEILSFRKK